jgi:hypothetical protein
MTPGSAHGTISINRLVKIVVITAIAFGVGFLGMAFLNRVGYLMAGALGAHPTGRGNLESQLITATLCAAIAAAAASWWTSGKDVDADEPRVRVRAVFAVLLTAVLMPIALWLWNDSSANAAQRQQFVNEMASGDHRTASWAADGLAHMPGGVATLRGILFDVDRPPDMRLLAGLELTQWLVDPPADVVSEVDAMIAQPGPMRQRFVEMHSSGALVSWPPAFERWMLVVLTDPDPKLKLAALGPLISRSEAPRPQLCTLLKQLARDRDPNIRAEAMLHTRACPDQQLALLKEGARDPDVAVRAAVLKRLGWRLIVATEDTASDLAERLSLADMLVDDPDPAIRAAAVEQRDSLRSSAMSAKR